MDQEIKARLTWIRLYEETGDAGLVCRRCGISRPTLRKWWRRYLEQGLDGLASQSRRPKTSPSRKVTGDLVKLILRMRRERKLGARRIQSELQRHHDFSLSLATIQKVLERTSENILKHRRIKRKGKLRYSRPTPGERLQMDTCKIAPGLYQYTAIDDCTRFRVLALYSKRTAANTLKFLDKVIEEMPFPIQRIQTDRGGEFFAYKFQDRLMSWGIKFRPIKPGSPHLNGKVERSQKTDLEEFYPTVDLSADNLHDLLDEWQFYYNWHRPHGSLGGKTPVEKWCELMHQTPLQEVVEDLYDESQERIRHRDYRQDLLLQKLKPCL